LSQYMKPTTAITATTISSVEAPRSIGAFLSRPRGRF
jgi:hypothetical protein